MNQDFWISRWNENKTAFHQHTVNSSLREHLPGLGLAPGARVFVPLCGKSLDMLWLRDQGYEVLGVELSPVAAEAFFEENNLPVEKESQGKFLRFQSGSLEILCGDFFDLKREHLAGVTGVYDRAALIALPEAMRARYARHLTQMLGPEAHILLISIEYPPHEMNGPPFPVMEQEIRDLFAEQFDVQLLHAEDVLESQPRFRERGLTELREKVFMLQRT